MRSGEPPPEDRDEPFPVSRPGEQFEDLRDIVVNNFSVVVRVRFELPFHCSVLLHEHRRRVFSIPQDNLSKHLLAVGQSGSGKTTLFYNLYERVDVPAWFFDLKQDYCHLASVDSDLLVLPWSKLRLNPSRPPNGVSPRRWAQVFSEMFGHSTALLSGSKNYLLKSVIKLYRGFNLFEEVSEPFPSSFELQALIKAGSMSYARKSSNYRDTVLNRLEARNLTAGMVCSSGHEHSSKLPSVHS